MKPHHTFIKRLLSLTLVSSLLVATSCSDDEGDDPATINPVTISASINEETQLTNIVEAEGLPDYIVDGFLDVNADLIIDPGVCIVFTANSGLFISNNGSLQAVGTSEKGIKFTGQAKTTGFWAGIQVRANDVRNELNYVTVEYAGSDHLATYGTNVKLFGGVAIEGVTGSNGSLKVFNSTFQNCDGYGLIVEHGTVLRDFSNNKFISNTDAAIRIDANNVGEIDSESTFTGNGLDGVEINASGSPTHDFNEDDIWYPLSNGAVYQVAQSFNAFAKLTILPGTTIEFEANQNIAFRQDFSGPNDGIIVAKGTVSEPITFTAATKTAGYWQGLIIESNSTLNEMDNCIVEYGGSDVISGGKANILLNKDGAFTAPDLKISNSIIRHSGGCGIFIDPFGANLLGSSITYADNVGADVCNE